MAAPVRLDKYLADMQIGTRSEVKGYIRKGRVMVNGKVVKDPDLKLNIEDTEVLFDNKKLEYEEFEYYMLNKPSGVVSATVDNTSKTVVDLITASKKKDIFPVGRLDKDTEGLLLITNDGELAHRLLSPRKHVGKLYFAKVKGQVTEKEVMQFSQGIEIDSDFTTLPAKLTILEAAAISTVEVTIYEGKFHQIKRMFEAVGMEVVYLKRLSMGELRLDETLAAGEYRRLTEDEITKLKNQDKVTEC